MNLKNVLQKYPTGSSICIYVGSFDPFHNGHREVSHIMTQYADCVIIVPNNPNKSKPSRTELEHRINMISISIADLKRVYVVSDDIRTIALEPNYYPTCGVMGSDQYLSLLSKNKAPHLDLDRWYIVPREHCNISGDDIDGKKPSNIQFLHNDLFKEQGWSSTMVREWVFDGEFVKLTCVHPKTLEYIVGRGLYSKKSCVEKKIWELLKGGGGVGQFVYIKDNVVNVNNEHIVKIFMSMDQFKLEKLSYDIMNDLIHKGMAVSVPIVMMTYCDDKYQLIGFSYEGATAEMLLGERVGEYDPTLIGQAIGKTLKTLHGYKQEVYDHGNGNNKLRKIGKEMQSLVDDFNNNPGKASYVHGDASLANFIIKADYKVVQIDFSGIAKYGSQGIPAYEYYQFISSVSWKIKDPELCAKVVDGFVEGYGETGFTQEADRLFKGFWRV